MALTVQDALDRARLPLNDADKVRYSDAFLLGYFNDAILMTRKIRSDLFLSQWDGLPSNLLVTDQFPVAEEYFPTIVDYVSGRAELIDDENVDNTRSQALLQLFMMGLKT